MKSRGLRQGVHTVHERRFDVRSAELVAVGQVGFDRDLQHADMLGPPRETDEPAPKTGARVHLDFRTKPRSNG